MRVVLGIWNFGTDDVPTQLTLFWSQDKRIQN